MQGRDSLASIRHPLDQALTGELQRLDRVIAQSWLVLAVLGFIASAIIGATVAPRLGMAMGIAAAIATIVFGFVLWRTSKGPFGTGAAIAVALAEGLMPWALFVVLLVTQGAAYAFASWIPPLVFTASIIAAAARLRPWSSLVVGLSGGVAYLLVYFLYARDHLPVGAARLILHEPPMQLSRAGTLAIAGAVGAYVARELRRAIARADRSVRKEELFGKYRLTRAIASGGVGAVHEAVYCPEGGFERRVAVKLLHPHLAREASFVASFRAEAELGSRLAHPNIATILDFGQQNDAYFLAMEYVDGLSLQRLLQGALEAKIEIPVSVAAWVTREILAGLEYAHDGVRDADGRALRVLHRDMCPANVLVSRFGEVKIADFGIARVLGDAESAHTRNVAGHAAYMAPEQAVAERIDVRADLFSVGVVLWEMLALRRLFARSNPVATLHALVAGAVPQITEVRAELDDRWNAFMTKSLARDPLERWQSAAEMNAALDALPGARSAHPMEDLAALTKKITGLPPAPKPAKPKREEEPTVQDSQG